MVHERVDVYLIGSFITFWSLLVVGVKRKRAFEALFLWPITLTLFVLALFYPKLEDYFFEEE